MTRTGSDADVPGDHVRGKDLPALRGVSRATVSDAGIHQVRPDRDDVFGRGYACREGLGLAAVDNDPDRLCGRLVREGDTGREASWEEAFRAISDPLLP